MIPRISVLATALLAIYLIPGAAAEPAKMELVGSRQRSAPFEQSLPVQVVVHGAKQSTLLGGSSRPAAEGCRVRFEWIDRPEGGQAEVTNEEVRTDAGGMARTSVRIISVPGTYILRVWLPDAPQIDDVRIGFLGGLRLNVHEQDGWVGSYLEQPVRIRAEKAPGEAMPGVKVEFDLRKAPSGTRLFDVTKDTDERGEAGAHIQLGKKQGAGELDVQILSPPWNVGGIPPALQVKFFAIDRVGLAIGVLGGLAIFIFGMRLMSEGLSLVAGDRLRALLGFLTQNRFAAVGVGAVTTGLIQSSSACSVMVIGFVNAGLMQLEQAIGVIMGANIGTTVTAQMLSFKLGALALPAITIGVVVSLLARKSRTRFMAQILIGFGLLFMGMGMMGKPLKELSDCVSVRSLFDGLSCTPGPDGVMPVGGVLRAVAAGTLLTVIVQSSSASIGLLLTLAGAGFLDIYTSTAILFGDNIGTTITAVLASIGSSRTAKRTACAHVLFNVIGTVVMILLFFVSWNGHPVFMELVDRLTAGDPFRGENLPRYLANAHTLFNVTCTVVFVWFISVFAAVTRMVVPGEDPQPGPRRLLDPHLLSTPAFALEQAWLELGVMLHKGREAIEAGFKAILGATNPDFDSLTESVRTLEREVDDLQSAITHYVSDISQEALTEEQGEVLPRLLHAVNDAERVGDYAMHLMRLARRTRKRSLEFTDSATIEMRDLFDSMEKLFSHAGSLLGGNGEEHIPHEDIDRLRQNRNQARAVFKQLRQQISAYRKAHENRHAEGLCDIRSGVIYVNYLLYLGRVSGHLLNIIEAASPQSDE